MSQTNDSPQTAVRRPRVVVASSKRATRVQILRRLHALGFGVQGMERLAGLASVGRCVAVIDLVDPELANVDETVLCRVCEQQPQAILVGIVPAGQPLLLRKVWRAGWFDALPVDVTDEVLTTALERAAAELESTTAGMSARDLREVVLDQARLACVGRLASVVASELYTPLTFLAASGELISRFASGDVLDSIGEPLDLRALGQDINATTDQMSRVLEGLRTLAEAGRVAPRARSFQRIIEEALAISSSRVGAVARIRRRYRPVADVMSTPGRMLQVVLNLLDNAVEALKEVDDARRERVVEVGLRPDGQQYVVAWVRDTGPGIEEEDIPRLFEPFFTSRRHTSARGLGLAIARAIVRAHGGSIWVESTHDEGSTFYVRLPVAGSAAAQRLVAHADDTELDPTVAALEHPAEAGEFTPPWVEAHHDDGTADDASEQTPGGDERRFRGRPSTTHRTHEDLAEARRKLVDRGLLS